MLRTILWVHWSQKKKECDSKLINYIFIFIGGNEV